MIFLGLVVPLALAAPACWLAARWHGLWRVAAGLGFAVAVPMIFQAAENLYFAPARTMALDMPLPLDRAAQFDTPPFRTAIGDTYDINLVTGHMNPRVFFCAAGGMGPDASIKAACGNRDNELNLAWTASAGAQRAASGGSKFAEWHDLFALSADAGAGLPPDNAPAVPQSGQDRSTRVGLGWLQARAGEEYRLHVRVQGAAPSIAGLHPRLQVTLDSIEYKSAGALNLFVLVGIFFGTIAILFANGFRRPVEAAGL